MLIFAAVSTDRLAAQPGVSIEMGSLTWDPATGTGVFPVLFTSNELIAGFQFDVVFDTPTGILSDACCGVAGSLGYDIGTGSTTVLGFSITLTPIPPVPAAQTLVEVTISTTNGLPYNGTICLENPVFADPNANSIVTNVGPCWDSGSIFRRGDCNGDLVFNLADTIYQLAFLFTAGPAGPCRDACDTNDDGSENLGDAIYSLAALFSGGPPPIAPGPVDCGPDDTSDALDCESYLNCN
ncbi:MAG: hypothetical protein CBC13_05005 [Planctomycetia bacterium TMED53]|nr:MAG: hypothetical protein CBC13_05005 [Planctomycetia bacterium TMED53]